MTVDQGMRTEVYQALREAHGEKVANALMDMLPPAGVPELATKADLAVLKSDFGVLTSDFGVLKSDFGVLRADFAMVRSELSGEIASLRSEMSSEFAAVRSEMAAEFAVVRSEFGERLERGLREQGNRFIGWMMATAGFVAAVAGAAAGLA